jgi:Cu-processing system permease protein
MRTIWSVFKFVFLDNLKSAWAIVYLLFYALTAYALIYFTGSFNRSFASLMNVVILIAPLVSTMMTSMYYFNKTDFIFLLLSQPVRRSDTFLGLYFGVAVTHSLAVGLGLGAGILFASPDAQDKTVLFLLILSGVLLSFVFCSLALFISVMSRDKLKGIGMAMGSWLFLAVIYDALVLMYFIVFADYPIEEHAIVLTGMNPIDLARVFIMLKLDDAALMGYSGAVFSKFFGSGAGSLISLLSMFVWIALPLLGLVWLGRKKDF